MFLVLHCNLRAVGLNIRRSLCKVTCFAEFKQTLIRAIAFSKNCLLKISVGTRLSHVETKTDERTDTVKLMVAFHNMLRTHLKTM